MWSYNVTKVQIRDALYVSISKVSVETFVFHVYPVIAVIPSRSIFSNSEQKRTKL